MCIRDRYLSALKNSGTEEILKKISSFIFGKLVIKKVIINPSEIDYLAKNGEIISVINQGNKLEVELQLRDNLIPVFESSNILIEDVDDT